MGRPRESTTTFSKLRYVPGPGKLDHHYFAHGVCPLVSTKSKISYVRVHFNFSKLVLFVSHRLITLFFIDTIRKSNEKYTGAGYNNNVNQGCTCCFVHWLLIHSDDPQSRPEVIIVFAHVVRSSVCTCTFQNLANRNKFQAMFTTGETVGLAEWIIDDTCLVLQLRETSFMAAC